MIITSENNEKVKMISKLKDKKNRIDSFIIEGKKIIEEAIKENIIIKTLVVKEDFNENIEFIKNNCEEIFYVTNNIIKKLSDVETSQGILAVVKKTDVKKIDTKQNCIFALDNIQDPGNLGTIIRTLDSANINQLVISKNTVDSYSSKVIRSTMGSIFRVNIIKSENFKDDLIKLKNDGFNIITTELNAEENLYEADIDKSVVVIGNEANGVSKDIREISNKKIKIPMLGKTESLNAAVATSIIIYEYVRRNL